MENKLISVIIPIYNNADSLIELSERIISTLDKIGYYYEIIYINDGSKDKSADILKLVANNKKIKVILLSRNFGQHAAISAGLDCAKGDYLVLMDGDLQDRPEEIPLLLKSIIDNDLDIIYTVKKCKNKIFATRISSAIYFKFFSKITNINIPLNIGTFRIFNKKVKNALIQYTENGILYGPLMHYIGFKFSYLELELTERPHGKSSYSFLMRLKLAFNSLISYTDIPHRISMWTGFLIFGFSFIYTCIILIQYSFFGNQLPNGTTLIIIFLSFSLGVILLTLGIIGNYVYRGFQESLNRPRYLIGEAINL